MGERLRRLWPGLAELGMAFGGLVLGYVVVGTGLRVVGLGSGPLTLLAGPLITGVAAAFYATIGPMWAELTRRGERVASYAGDAGDEGDERDERKDRKDRKDREDRDESPGRAQAAGVGAALATVSVGLLVALGGSIALGVLFEKIGMQVQEQSSVLDITEGARAHGFGLQAAMLVLAALVLAPMAEEWLFRGLLFRRVAVVSGRWLAYGISALGFAAIHGNPAGFVVYLWLGLVFAAVLERTGRLWTAVLVHMGNNGFVLALLFTGSDMPG